jgi:hypothetical protein
MNKSISSAVIATFPRVLRTQIVLLFTATATLLAGCGDAEIAKGDVEQAAMKTLTDKVGKPSPPITCPGSLKAKIGATLTCSMPLDGKDYDVKVAVSSIEGSTAGFSVEVGDKPRG